MCDIPRSVAHFLRMDALVLCLLWSLVEVHSQTEFPYVSFRGETLPNHSYVNLTEVGVPFVRAAEYGVECHTNLTTCCSRREGEHRGDWCSPDGSRLPFSADSDIFERRTMQQVYIARRNNANSTSGIYRCDIQVNNALQSRQSVYVGVYHSGGKRHSIFA